MDKSEKIWSKLEAVQKEEDDIRQSIYELLERLDTLQRKEEELKNEYAAEVLQIGNWQD